MKTKEYIIAQFNYNKFLGFDPLRLKYTLTSFFSEDLIRYDDNVDGEAYLTKDIKNMCEYADLKEDMFKIITVTITLSD